MIARNGALKQAQRSQKYFEELRTISPKTFALHRAMKNLAHKWPRTFALC